MKICSKCGTEKTETEFRKYHKSCKDCEKIQRKDYAIANPEKVAQSRKKYYIANIEKRIERYRKWRELNPKKIIVKKESVVKHKKIKKENHIRREIAFLRTDNKELFQVKYKNLHEVFDIKESEFDILFEQWNEINDITINRITTYHFITI